MQALTIGTSEGNGSLLPAVLLSYSVAVHGSRRVAVTALCAIPVAAAIRELNNPENTTVSEVLNGLGWDIVIVAAWLLGAYVRTRRQLVAELRQRAADSAEAAAAAERARVARELHDVLAHSLGVVVVQAEAAEEALARRPELAAESLRSIQRTGREALVEVRRLVGVLREDEAVREPARGAARGRRAGAPGQRDRAPGRARGARLGRGAARGAGPGGLPDRAGVADQRAQARRRVAGARAHRPAGPTRWRSRSPTTATARAGGTDRLRATGCAGCGSGSPPWAARSRPGPAGDGGFAVRAVLSLGSPREHDPGAAGRRPGAGARRVRHDPRPAGRHRGGRRGRATAWRPSRRPARWRRTWC